jgi:nucleotide-binding universal stress UspA family protein
MMNQQMKILIGYDGSSCADAALLDLWRAGLPQTVEAVVMCVADVLMPPQTPPDLGVEGPPFPASVPEATRQAWTRALRAIEEAEALAKQAGERLQTYFPAWKVRAEARADSPAWGLVKKADEWKPDLLVVGSHGRSALARLILGSVSQKVLTEARCSVRIARGRTDAQDGPVRIVVGVDGSADAEAAVRAITRRVWPAGSEARVLTAIDGVLATVAEQPQTDGENEWGWARQAVEGAAEALRDAGLVVSSRVAEGNPKRLLPAEAEAWRADCIFLGARGLRGVKRFLLGSVSTAVAARVHCSVEVVRFQHEE